MQSPFLKQETVDAFCRFSNYLGAKLTEAPKTKLKEMPLPSRLISREADANLEMEVYFTEAGVKKIQETSYELALKTYLEAQVHLDERYKGMPCHTEDAKNALGFGLLKDYHRLSRGPVFGSARRSAARQKLREDYERVLGRPMVTDAALFARADDFAKRVEKLKNVRDEKQVMAFFTDIGRARHFDYMGTIAALQQIAGVKETFIHELSMKGCGLSMQAVEAPAIPDPADAWLQAIEA